MEVTQRRESGFGMMVHGSSMEESAPPTARERMDEMDLTTESINDRQRYLLQRETIAATPQD